MGFVAFSGSLLHFLWLTNVSFFFHVCFLAQEYLGQSVTD